MSFNLPPGCTDAMVDAAMGSEEPQCFGCGKAIDEGEMVWWRGKERPACDRCAAHVEDGDR